MQRANVIVFIVLSAAILGGWFWWATSNQKTDDIAQGDKKDKKPKDDDDDKKKADKKKADEDKLAKDKADKDKKKADDDKLAKDKADKDKKKPALKVEPARSETLGGDGFHLSVVTTQRGGGIRQVILNRFDAADWRGRPKLDDQGKSAKLELIQDDEHAPSYRMYHYIEPKDENPIFGLGEAIWTAEGRNPTGESVHWVKYSTTVPGHDLVKITKTYRLAPTDYHVTLELEIYDQRSSGKPIPFRYQLTGAQGIPIEGEWYSENATCRNAFIGLADPRERLWRKLEDSLRISQRRGGDTWPENKYTLGDNRLQYAGVANQYFGAMLVVDDQQADGVDRNKILAWARPTLETREKRGEIVAIGDDFVIFKDYDSLVARDRLYKIIQDQTKTRDDTAEGVSEKLLTAQKELVKKASEVRKMWLSHPDEVESALDTAIAALERAVEHIDAGKTKDAGAEQEKALKEFVLARTKLGVPVHYTMLPRAKRHLGELDLAKGDRAVISTYDTPDGRSIATWFRLGETLKPQFDDITVRVNSGDIDLHPRDKIKHQFMLYHGPVKAALLGQFTGEKAVPADVVERYTHTSHLRTLTDYPYDNFFGRISSWIMLTDVIILVTRLMHWLLNVLHAIFYIPQGVTIIVLTIIVRGCMFPISRKQALFSARMQELAPELKKVQEKYKDDPTGKMQATQEFYRKHGINPLGSCWPIFLQMPIFLGLYFAFQESVHFRLADFLWIKSLSAPDMFFFWTESIPIISSPDHGSGIFSAFYLGPYFNVLPPIAAVCMMIQQMQMMPPPTDEQTAMQQKMLKWMPILFAIMFYKVAAGLCIYFISTALWGLAERKLLPKKKPVADAGQTNVGAPSTNGPATPTSAKGKGKWAKKDKEKDKAKEPVTTFDKLKALWRDILKQAEKK